MAEAARKEMAERKGAETAAKVGMAVQVEGSGCVACVGGADDAGGAGGGDAVRGGAGDDDAGCGGGEHGDCACVEVATGAVVAAGGEPEEVAEEPMGG